MKIIIRILIAISFLFPVKSVIAQDPKRYSDDVEEIVKRYSEIPSHKNLIVFTGSSSIRLWKDFSTHFPGKNIINTGFGGSHMSDLIFYINELIINYKPVQVFVYEGDNDLASGKSPEDVTRLAETLCKLIWERLPETEIVFIAAKPSPSRWHLKDNYINLNTRLSDLDGQSDRISYADIWSIMVNKNGRPDGSLFTDDSLHMNNNGYLLWAKELSKKIR